jgi:hypothetical protein
VFLAGACAVLRDAEVHRAPALRHLVPSRRAGGARVVNVSSVGHITGEVLFDDPNFQHHRYDPWTAYGQSKTANILFAIEMARRWSAEGITANALNPGRIAGTRLIRHVSPLALLRNVLIRQNPAPRSRTSRRARRHRCCRPRRRWSRVSPGKYFENCQEAERVRLAHDTTPNAGLARRAGTVFIVLMPVLTGGLDLMTEGRAGTRPASAGERPRRDRRLRPGGRQRHPGESSGQGPDFAKALGDRDPARASVLLAHQPVVIHDAVKYGIGLQLSGHTHRGQLWPGNYVAELSNPTVASLEQYGDTALYVTRGAGAWGPPVRIGAPADITVVQLASRQS